MLNNCFYPFLFLIIGFILSWLAITPVIKFTFSPFKVQYSKATNIHLEIGTLNFGFGRIVRPTSNGFEVIWLLPFLSYVIRYSKNSD